MISKSKIKQNKQCRKNLWLELNKPFLKQLSEQTKKSFSRGRQIETIAQDYFPNAVKVKSRANVKKIEETKKLLSQQNKTIFEASFVHDDVIVMADVIDQKEDLSFDIIEIKSGTKITQDYLDDIIIQFFTIKKSGVIKINKYYIWHVNNKTDGDDLFTRVDITEQVSSQESYYQSLVDDAKTTSLISDEIRVPIGSHCNNPYECSFKNYCWRNVLGNPKSILNMPKLSKKWELYHSGVKTVYDLIKHKNPYIEDHKHVVDAILNNRLELKKDLILKELNKFKFPLAFLDFESIMSALPVFDDQLPYEQIVFQLSIHTIENNGDVLHYEYLHRKEANPKEDIKRILIDILSKYETILCFNKSFEITRINELIKISNDEEKEILRSIIDKIKDLADLFEDFVYHPDLMGSFSLKKLSKVILKEIDLYQGSRIKSGDEVSDIYIALLQENDHDVSNQLEQDLKIYNKIDTLNLVLLYYWLKDEKVNIKELLEKYNSSKTVTII